MIEMVDEHFGKILDHLEQTGELENTIVIFSTDHGESCGDHGLTQKGPRFFEGMVNVPLIMALPGAFQAGLKSDALVELTDIMPTLMECVGLPIPDDVQGRSLLPILTGEASPTSTASSCGPSATPRSTCRTARSPPCTASVAGSCRLPRRGVGRAVRPGGGPAGVHQPLGQPRAPADQDRTAAQELRRHHRDDAVRPAAGDAILTPDLVPDHAGHDGRLFVIPTPSASLGINSASYERSGGISADVSPAEIPRLRSFSSLRSREKAPPPTPPHCDGEGSQGDASGFS